MSAGNILANLQGHQCVLQRELEEINSDLVQLQQMASRYTVQNGISFSPAIEQLTGLRIEKESLLAQVGTQLASMQATMSTSNQLVSALQHQPVVAPSLIIPATASPSRGTRWNNSAVPMGVASPSIANSMTRSQLDASLAGGVPNGVVHLSAPGGLMVTTNSTILSNSPARQRY